MKWVTRSKRSPAMLALSALISLGVLWPAEAKAEAGASTEADVSLSLSTDETDVGADAERDGGKDSWAELRFPSVTSGWQGGFSTGFAMGMGKFSSDSGELADTQRGAIPLLFEVGYRFSPHFYAGAYGQMAFLLLRQGGMCVGEDNHCSGQDYRAGLTVAYHFTPTSLVDPWVSLGAGYEWYYYSVSIPTAGVHSQSLMIRGWEMVNVRLGVDIHETRQAALGPFVAWTSGQFTNYTYDGLAGEQKTKSDAIKGRETHQWLIFGIQGSFYDNI